MEDQGNYLWIQVQGGREVLDGIALVTESLVEFTKQVMYVGLIGCHILQNLQLCQGKIEVTEFHQNAGLAEASQNGFWGQ